MTAASLLAVGEPVPSVVAGPRKDCGRLRSFADELPKPADGLPKLAVGLDWSAGRLPKLAVELQWSTDEPTKPTDRSTMDADLGTGRRARALADRDHALTAPTAPADHAATA